MAVTITGTGPSALRSYLFPDANCTILTTNAAVTPAQGGTGIASYTGGDLLYASGAATLAKLAAVATGYVLASAGVSVAPGWANNLTLFSLTLTSSLTVSDVFNTGTTGYRAANAAFFYWSTRAAMTSPADAQINLTNNAASVGIGLDFTVDAVLKVRTRAQSAYAQVDALGYSTGGVAGVTTFGPAAVASITVKGGIITAIS